MFLTKPRYEMERMTSIVFIATDVDYLNLWISNFKKQKTVLPE